MRTEGPALLVDGSNLLMRCIKAMEHSGLRGGQRQDWQTGPLTAFIGALSRFCKDYRPGAAAVCWDEGPSKRRLDLHPGYKASRTVPTAEQAERKETAFGMTRTFLKAAGIQQVSVPGYEADDVIAAYWATACHDVRLIVSGDKDFLQLVDERTAQLRPDGGGGYRAWTVEEVEDHYGCSGWRLPLLMALMGDASDGVPGVRGLGPKKALSALQSADWSLGGVGVLQDADKRSSALTSLALVDLRDRTYHPDVPPLEPFRPTTIRDTQASLELVKFLRGLEMETVISRFYTNTLWS